MLPEFESEILDEEYGTEVVLTLRLPEEHVERFVGAVSGLTNGQARIRRS